ncbi:hypothetical protein [Enterococcus ratti]|uniref:Uncharacterized protein n=1 Tax=Enterococcus ratti TaxID=150033 RepID=A0A1L8WNX3_9ENTE|nr:hypothetical protein [Enterococcus ratti]OJG82733.1 hypothetical protein RV14_GL002308 [Enterococcus ratti]
MIMPKMKTFTGLATAMFLFEMLFPTVSIGVQASEIFNEEMSKVESICVSEEKRSNQVLKILQEMYA